MNTLSIQRPFPSMLIPMLCSLSVAIAEEEVDRSRSVVVLMGQSESAQAPGARILTEKGEPEITGRSIAMEDIVVARQADEKPVGLGIGARVHPRPRIPG